MRTRDAFLELISPGLARASRDRRVTAPAAMRGPARPETLATAGYERLRRGQTGRGLSAPVLGARLSRESRTVAAGTGTG